MSLNKAQLVAENRALKRKNRAVEMAQRKMEEYTMAAKRNPTAYNMIIGQFCTQFLIKLIKNEISIEDWMLQSWIPDLAADGRTVTIYFLENYVGKTINAPFQPVIPVGIRGVTVQAPPVQTN